MSALNGKQVTAATMHESIFVNGIGELRKELSNKDDGTHKAVKMTIDEPFLILEHVNSKFKQTTVIPVPLTNFKNLVLAKE